MNAHPLNHTEGSVLAARLLRGCVITAVSSLSATLSVELTRDGGAGGLPTTFRLQAFAAPRADASERARAACRAVFGTSQTSDENLDTIAGALLLLALQSLAAPIEDARIESDGALRFETSAFGWIQIPALRDASTESSWILDVPAGHAHAGAFLEASGDGNRLTSSFASVREE